MARPKATIYQWARDSRRVQVCGGGSSLRIFDHVGRARQVAAADTAAVAAIVAAVGEHDEECARRIVRELDAAGVAVEVDAGPPVDGSDS